MFTRMAIGILGGLMAGLSVTAAAAAPATPVILELFTSQSCSSCPSADALLKKLAAADPSLLALSYHVDYWDYLSWKDTYSSPANTERQRNYSQVLGGGVFTPELIVNGTQAMVGSNDANAANAITQAKQAPLPITVSIVPKGNQLMVTIGANSQAGLNADILEIYYDRYAKTNVKAGENGGRMLESINNVTQVKRLPALQTQTIAVPNDGVAILVQAPNQGKILGAAFYNK